MSLLNEKWMPKLFLCLRGGYAHHYLVSDLIAGVTVGLVGARTAAQKHAACPGHFPGADWPLAVVQIDHTRFDRMLVDDIHRLDIPKGRFLRMKD